MKSNLPMGWAWVTLEELSHKISDGSHNPPKGQESGIPMLSAKNIQANKIEFDDARLISEKDYQAEISRINIAAGDVLLTIVGTIGRTAYVPEGLPKFSLQRSVAIIKPRVDGKFVAFWLRSPSVQHYLVDNAKGTAQKGIYLNSLKNVLLPLPPLAEQARIVAHLDATMQRVEASQERLEKIPELLKQFRQAVLAAAVSGRLTEAWRAENPQSETTNELITRLLEARKEIYEVDLVKARHDKAVKPKKPQLANTSDTGSAELPELPDPWLWVDFATACEKIFDGTHFSPKNYAEGDYKYITAKNIKEKGLDLSNITYLTAEDHASIYARADVKRGDVLYIKDGATTGIATVNTLDEEFSLLSSVGVFRTNSEFIIPEYVSYFLNAPNTRQRMLSEVAGIAITRLTLTKLNGSFLALPPYEEQKEIVRQINHYFKIADALETRLEQATAMVEQLNQALLAKAFSGQLVAQDPNDESASVLLERLRNLPAPTKTKRAAKAAATSSLPLEFTMPQSLQEILQQNPEGLSPEKLFSMAGFTEVEVDTFYQELASLQPQLEELKPTGDGAKMWPNTSTTLRLKYTSHED